jgi:hypothetical protein
VVDYCGQRLIRKSFRSPLESFPCSVISGCNFCIEHLGIPSWHWLRQRYWSWRSEGLDWFGQSDGTGNCGLNGMVQCDAFSHYSCKYGGPEQLTWPKT